MHLYLEQLAREAFKEFDKDNSGTIDQKVDSFTYLSSISNKTKYL